MSTAPATLEAPRLAAEARDSYGPRVAALGALFVATACEHFTVRVGAFTVKPEHVVLLLLLAAALWRGARGVRSAGKWDAWRGSRPAWPLSLPAFGWLLIVLFLSTMLLSSALNSPDTLSSLRHTAMVALVVSGAWLVERLVLTPELFRFAVRLLVILGVAEAAVTFAALAATRFGFPFGTQPGSAHTTVPYGTLWEPNFLGSYLAAACVLAIALLPSVRSTRARVWLAAGLTLMLTALGLSLARASWIALLVGAGVVVWSYRLAGSGLHVHSNDARPATWWHKAGLQAVAPALLAILGALALLVTVTPLLFPDTARGIFVRIDMRDYTPSTDLSIQSRATTIQQSWVGIAAHPLVGNGAGSYGTNHIDEKGQPGWISNLELHLLYDSGIIGLFALLGGVGALCWLPLRALKSRARRDRPGYAGPAHDCRPEVIGLLGAISVLLVAYQATEGLWLGFTWVYVGLLAKAATLYRS